MYLSVTLVRPAELGSPADEGKEMKVGWAQAFYMYDFVIFSSYTNIKLIENTIPLITVRISENALKFAFTFFGAHLTNPDFFSVWDNAGAHCTGIL